MISVANSRTIENAFDLSLGVNGYYLGSLRFFNNKECFVAKQKKSKQIA